MSEPNSPADKVSKQTIRTSHEFGQKVEKSEPQFKSGRKYRLVFRRKGVEVDPTTKRQAESLQRAAVDGKPFCEECEKRQPGRVRIDLSPNVATAAKQAKVLELAAQDGVPFCEECAKAAAKKAPQAPPIIDPATAAAQAATLQSAAKSGIPFCAECEKLKKQKQQEKKEQDSKPAQAQQGASPEKRPADAPPAKPDEQKPIIDEKTAAAQAATLTGAAKRGSPFCEECAKAREQAQPAASAT